MHASTAPSPRRCSGIELVSRLGAEVTQCTCMVELTMLGGRQRAIDAGAKDVLGFITESLLTRAAVLPESYVDDGAAH